MGIFGPAWRGNNEKKAKESVLKISDKSKLEEVVNNAPLDSVRYIAIKKLSSMPNVYGFGVAEKLFDRSINTQSFIKDVALNEPDRMFRQFAVRKLDDPKIIAQIAKNDPNEYVREEAVERLDDQSVLSEIIRHDSKWNVRLEAVKKLTDQSLLSYTAKNDLNESVRQEAVNKVNDQSVLADLALNDTNWEVRRRAIDKVEDQSVIAAYLIDESKRVGAYSWFHSNCNPKGLLKRIDSQNLILRVANEINSDSISEEAAKRITDENALISIVKNEKASTGARYEVFKRIHDESILAEIAMDNDVLSSVRLEAIRNLSDINALSDLMGNKSNHNNIRREAAWRLGKTCSHQWEYDAHCRRKCSVCGLFEYDHDYVEVNAVEHGNAVSSADYVCKRCGHKAAYWQNETSSRDTREQGVILED